MLRWSAILALVAVVVLGAASARVQAALDGNAAAEASNLELLVFQVDNCRVCELVQTHIRPAYERSRNAKDAPMRFVDLNSVDGTALGLAEPITIVPTVVLMREGREVSRMTGYTGPIIFFDALTHMMRAVD